MNRNHVLSLAALTALVAFSGISRADDFPQSNDGIALSEQVSEPMTCAQATAFAWFKHQLELTDGSNDSTVDTPAECERTYLAKSPNSDDGDK